MLQGPIGRTGPDLLADALVAVGLQRRGGMFDKEVLLDGVGEAARGVGAVGQWAAVAFTLRVRPAGACKARSARLLQAG